MRRRSFVLGVVCLVVSLPMFGLTFTVTTTADAGAGSLAFAIVSANGNPGPDTIEFNIPAGGVQTILTTGLPPITDTVTIDGYTQPGASANTLAAGSNANILIAIQGQSNLTCMTLFGNAIGSTVRGLSVGGCLIGISINGADAVNLMGNFIGISPSGGTFANDLGIYVSSNASPAFVGSGAVADRNVISFNATGITLGSEAATVRNNLIGTSPDGLNAAGNSVGVRFLGGSNSQVTENIISGNNLSSNSCGVRIVGASNANAVTFNFIGLDAAGSPLPNRAGVCIVDDSISGPTGNDIANNIIGNNVEDGIRITPGGVDSTGNRFSQNNFDTNGGLPIDLGDDGVTANDAGDTDSGPNHLLNYPVITSAVGDGTQLTITGTLDAPAGSGDHSIDFYSLNACNGFAQWIGQTNVSVVAGPTPFTATINTPIAAGLVSATATSTTLFETSELAACQAVTAPTVPALIISDATIAEGDAGSSNVSVTVSLSAASASDVQVEYLTSDGTAAAPADYATTGGVLTIVAGNTSGTIVVPVNGDPTVELDETFTVIIGNPQNATITDDIGVVTIADDDLPSITIDDASKLEGLSGTSALALPVTLSSTSPTDVVIPYGTSNGSATAPFDYAPATGTLTIPAGDTSGTILVTINGDSTMEPDETFIVTLSVPANATVADGTATGTILNDDVPSISIADTTISEGNSGTSDVSLTVTLSQTSPDDVQMNYGTIFDTATAPSDYTATSGTLVIPAGSTSGTILVPIVGDTTAEPNETFQVALTSPQNATFYDNVAVVTITDDDSGFPSMTIADASIVEGDSGASNLSFLVTLSATFASDVQVNYLTNGGSAVAPSDYTVSSGTLTIPAGNTTGTIVVPIAGDTNVEGNETFTVTLSAPQNTILADDTAVATIENDDSPSITIADGSWTEGDSGTSTLSLLVTLSVSAPFDVQVTYQALDGSAVAPGDYTITAGVLTIPAGSTTGAIPITIVGDTAVETDETLSITLYSPQNATIADSSGEATILNDDAAPGPSITIADASIVEGNAGTSDLSFAVTLSAISPSDVQVNFLTSDGTAVEPVDYTSTSGTLTIPAGSTSGAILVPIVGDANVEADETFTLTLSAPQNATIGDGTATATITNDDAPPVPSISIANASIIEGNSGTSLLSIAVTLSSPSSSDIQVNYLTSDGTATAPADYTATSGTLTILAGNTAGTIVIPIIGDTGVESNETFTVTLSAPQNATIGDGTATATITSDDDAEIAAVPTLSELGLALFGAAIAVLAFLRLR